MIEPEYKRGDVISVIGGDLKWVVEGYSEGCYTNGLPWSTYKVWAIEKLTGLGVGYRHREFAIDYARDNTVRVGTWDFEMNKEKDDE